MRFDNKKCSERCIVPFRRKASQKAIIRFRKKENQGNKEEQRKGEKHNKSGAEREMETARETDRTLKKLENQGARKCQPLCVLAQEKTTRVSGRRDMTPVMGGKKHSAQVLREKDARARLVWNFVLTYSLKEPYIDGNQGTTLDVDSRGASTSQKQSCLHGSAKKRADHCKTGEACARGVCSCCRVRNGATRRGRPARQKKKERQRAVSGSCALTIRDPFACLKATDKALLAECEALIQPALRTIEELKPRLQKQYVLSVMRRA